MRKIAIMIIAILSASPALAGVCNGVGNYTYCSGDNGSQTSIQRNGNYYQVQTYDGRGHFKTEGYWNYNNSRDDDR